MRSNYKQLGNYIREVNIRNSSLKVELLLGVSIQKKFIPSIANTIGTDMSTYKIVKKNQFAYGPVTSRNGDKISIALLEDEQAIISQAYRSFEVKDKNELLPEYLMMWFKRPEFDRYARFMSHGSTREVFDWNEMCETKLPIPHIDKQREIVKEYNVLVNRINLNSQLIQKLEETAQTIYKQWFVDFEFPNENGKPYKSNGGEMVFNEELEKDIPKSWEYEKIIDLCSIEYGKSLPKSEILLSSNGQYDVYGAGRIIGKFNKYTKEKSSVIVGCRGSVGSMSLTSPYSFITNNSLIFNFKESEKFFYYYQIIFRGLDDTISGSAQPQITIEGVSGVKLLIPAEEIIDEFNKFAECVNNNIFNNKVEIEKNVEISNILLSRLSMIKS